MEVFRLSRRKFAKPLSGIGAAIKGARWNSPGVELIYTSSNRSLAMAEVAVHFGVGGVPRDYVMVTIYMPPDISITKITEASLPADWNVFPYYAATHLVGDRFVASNKYCALQVPSAVTKGDYNILINPRHADFRKIKIVEIEDFPFDRRIFK